MKRSRIWKLAVLLLFLGILTAGSWYLWKNYVLKSPYYKQNDRTERTN